MTIKRRLPATAHSVSGRLISPAGQEYVTDLVITNNTGRAYRATLVGNPPAWSFSPLPNCAEILADFNTCAALLANVPSCNALLTWGFA